MSKIFLRVAATLPFAGLSGSACAQPITEHFDNIATLADGGWSRQNISDPVGTTNWFQGDPVAFPAHDGTPNAYIAADFRNTGGTGTISNWLLTPNRTFRNGDVLRFHSRVKVSSIYPDRLEVRLSTNGASTNAGTTATDVGDFTSRILVINEGQEVGGYPETWTEYTITFSGLPAPSSGRVAFRYFVTNAGISGSKSDYIGIDNVLYTPYICPMLTLGPASLGNGTWGQSYSASLSQVGALGTPTYQLIWGALPQGLTLSAGGSISGTPTANGTFDFGVMVSDNSGCMGSKAYSITVQPDLPGAPQNVGASAGDTQADVTWEAPVSDGGESIDSYSATCTDGTNSFNVSGTLTPPITVTGLANGTAYTCTVSATNDVGPGPASAPSNSVTPMAHQTITFDTQADQTYSTDGTFDIAPLASASSGLDVIYGSATQDVCIVNGMAFSTVGIGTCTLTADQPGNDAWHAAPQVTQSLTVAPDVPGAPRIVVASAGDAQATVTWVAPVSDGGVSIDSYTVTCTDGTNDVGTSGAASPVTATGLTNGTSYTCTVAATNSVGTGPASDPSNSVTPAGNQTITFDTQPGQAYSPGGTFAIDPPASASSDLAVVYGSATTDVCTVNGATVSIAAAGTCTLTADQPGDIAWNAAPQVTQSLVIARAGQVLTFPPQSLASRWFEADATFDIAPEANSAAPHSGEPIIYSSLDAGVCTVSGTTVTMEAEGTCRIAADQGGNDNFVAATQIVVQVALVTPTEADLWIEKTAAIARAHIGDMAAYSILVGNDGPADAVDVHVLDLPPERLDAATVVWQCVEATGTGCPDSGVQTGELFVTIASLPEGATVRLELFGVVIPAADSRDDFTAFDNTASVGLLQGSGLTDPAGNNESTASVLVVPYPMFADGFEASPQQ